MPVRVLPMERAKAENADTAPDDAALLESIAAHKDRDAFQALYERHAKAVYNLARYLTRNAERAEDAAQAAWVRVWVSAGSYAAEGTVRGWLLRVAVREVIRHVRSDTREKARVERVAAVSACRTLPPTDHDMEHEELLGALRSELTTLPETERRLLAMYFGGGLSQDEIAKLLKISQSKVSYTVGQTLDLLRRRLSQAGFAAALPLLNERGLSEALCGGAEPPAALQPAIFSQLAHAGRALSRRAAAASGSSTLLPWAVAAATMLAAAAVFRYLPEKKSAGDESANSPAAEAAGPKTDAAANTGTGGDIEKPFRRFWSFEGAKVLPRELEVLDGTYEFRASPLSGKGVLRLPDTSYTRLLIRVQTPGRPVLLKLVASPATDGNIDTGIAVTDGETYASTLRRWPCNRFMFKETGARNELLFQVSGRFGLSSVAGQLNGMVELARLPGDRYLSIGMRNLDILSIELRDMTDDEIRQFDDRTKQVQAAVKPVAIQEGRRQLRAREPSKSNAAE